MVKNTGISQGREIHNALNSWGVRLAGGTVREQETTKWNAKWKVTSGIKFLRINTTTVLATNEQGGGVVVCTKH